MNEIIKSEEVNIENMIYEIRGKQVMLDRDLAKLYQVETKRINEAVARNIKKFPNRISWVITKEEKGILWSQNATANISSKSRVNPRVFTEQAIYMLATVLKSDVAIEVSIMIMDAFVLMRHYIGNNRCRLNNIETKVIEHDNSIKLLQESFDKLSEKKKVNDIYFSGQIYDAYSAILDIFNKANNSLVIIDAYADKSILDIIKRLKVNVIIITKKDNLLHKTDIDKYNKQYNNLKVIFDNSFHDRYFILDNRFIYHSGTSLNRIGYKTFCINIISDEITYKSLLNYVNSLINNRTYSTT